MVRTLVSVALLAAVGVVLWRMLQPRGSHASYHPPTRDEYDPVDQTVDDSFPASDPPSFTPTTGARR